jgi:phospholipid/cholesterol/gamma-HCH transport system substrate-binding protein
MANYTKAEFRVGVLVLAAVISLAAGVWMIGGPLKRTDTVYIYFNMVKGLNQGDLVKLAGVRIGWIEDMVHSPSDDNPYEKDMVKLVCKIYADRFTALGEQSRAYIESSGIVGQYYIELGFRPPGTPVLNPEGYILGEEPYGIEDITRGLAENLNSLQSVIGDEKARKDFHKTIANLSEITEKAAYLFGDVGSVTETIRMLPKIARETEEGVRHLRDAAENVNRLVGSATPQISSSIENVNAATARVRGEFMDQASHILTKLDKVSEDLELTSRDVRDLVSSNKERIDATLASAQVAAGTFAVSMDRLDRLVAKVERGEGTIGKLLVDKTWEENVGNTIEGANETLGSYRGLAEKFSSLSRPRLLYEFRSYEDDEDSPYRNNNFRNDAGLRFDFGKNWAYLGANDIGKDDDLELTAGRWFTDWLTVYGGVIESEAALGLGLRPHERFTLWMEGVGLTDEDEERLDLTGQIKLLDKGSLLFGVEDVGGENWLMGGLRLEL